MGDRAPPPNQQDEQTLFLKMRACLPGVRTVCVAITICWVLTTCLLVHVVYDWKNDEVYACNNHKRTLEKELSERQRNWSECERTLQEVKSELHRNSTECERTLQKEMSELNRNWTECATISQENAALFHQYSTASWTIRNIQRDSKSKTRSIDRLTSQLTLRTVEHGDCETRFEELEKENKQQGNKLDQCEVDNTDQTKKTAKLQTSIKEKDDELGRMEGIVNTQGEQLSHTWETSQVVWVFVGGMVAGIVFFIIFIVVADWVSTKK